MLLTEAAKSGSGFSRWCFQSSQEALISSVSRFCSRCQRQARSADRRVIVLTSNSGDDQSHVGTTAPPAGP